MGCQESLFFLVSSFDGLCEQLSFQVEDCLPAVVWGQSLPARTPDSLVLLLVVLCPHSLN